MRSIIKDYLYYVIMLTIVIIICLVLYILYIWKQDQPANNDYYKDFAALKADTKAHKDWEINTKTTNNKDILITAIHGGGIEPGTSELAKIISKKGDYNLYSFEGLLPSNNKKLHITSTNFDDPKLTEMVYKSNEAISIHGIEEDNKAVYIGGKDKKMAKSITKYLEKEGFNVKKSPRYVNGDSEHNIINKNDSGSGVQIEISTKYRKQFFEDDKLNRSTRENTSHYRQNIYDFAEAVTKGIKEQTNKK
ncbi:poly-gamma-glutamate hydrolase family protein [Staphylococcus gallinarum]|uniref:poly-gamma-glutamate hydrolase family protein n=1 Tax=Staphylococcus gallinarum TaxID=1293 RepID=UPI002DBA4417|nr:poly-gamma-glutamate hydrolase family protein [Staphylococcus gallinarum]MEB6242547.1 poly-gamma-glutamate hydrolase family protein [Staphylococcus gallinarum]MEB6295727.1 poly-gamma-glutamate hydrolase family protein [Staphylococcus gallinarum]